MRILLTGGTGFIGSHTAVELLHAGYEVTIIDNLMNSKASVIDRIEEISGCNVSFHQVNLLDEAAAQQICRDENIDAAIHFAGLKAAGDSVEDPLLYHSHNLNTAISLCRALLAADVRKLVFSSSAMVYGDPETVPLTENNRANVPTNPYGRTKIFIEEILSDLHVAEPSMNIARLRYFNPAGAHPSGNMGEDPSGKPNNLIPFVTQVAIGMRPQLTINGDDYETPDGTCVRDYIHVQDLARGHVAALEKLKSEPGLVTYNLGTGEGTSVKEVVAAFELATGEELPRTIGPRRAGDVPAYWCDPTLAEKELGWRAELTIDDICRDAWRWQQQNPNGYP